MSSLQRMTLFLFAILFCFGFATPRATPGWQLVWDDEFDHDGLPDSTKWNYDTGGDGWGNHELEFYTAGRPENAHVKNGNLVIEARKEKWDKNNYTSARLVTKDKGDWKYGRIIVSAKLPEGLGTWPAIWMLGSVTPLHWPDDGEIDIMEHVGYDPGMIHASVHCKKYNHVIGTQKTAIINEPGFANAFHIYALEWNTDSLSIFIDEKKYFTFTNEHSGYAAWPFDQPMHLLLNLAIGGDWGGKKGIDDSGFPKQMLVNYVRVYQRK
jgi:beta-glucanase (GH16 family)